MKELFIQLKERRAALYEQMLKVKMRKAEKPMLGKTIRREIARIMTELNTQRRQNA
jgi:ribosomal protein L29